MTTSNNAAAQFHMLTLDLLLRRAETGGLSMDEERARTCELGDLWEQMTEEEQEAEEAWFCTAPQAPESLGMKDCVVLIGQTHMPRVSG